jgi:hypothetical protein
VFLLDLSCKKKTFCPPPETSGRARALSLGSRSVEEGKEEEEEA